MHAVTKGLIAAAMIAGPMVANADAVTVDFTGTITTATGLYAADSGTISGSFVFEFGNATTTAGTIGSPSWAALGNGTVFATSNIVGTSAGDAGLAYSDGAAGAFGQSGVAADATASGGSNFLAFNAQGLNVNGDGTTSLFAIVPTATPSTSWDMNGIPVLNSGDQAGGSFGVTTNGITDGNLSYTVTSLSVVAPTAAPEIDSTAAASALSLLLGGVIVLRGRRSAQNAA